ncbi:MAG: hypothetical protein Q7Q71_15000 [Verrucomicrobiota bacterium JB023]|nr:hypothetical protein [Verrucomicrobiota bacterium JB023]
MMTKALSFFANLSMLSTILMLTLICFIGIGALALTSKVFEGGEPRATHRPNERVVGEPDPYADEEE